ncbi:MAG TPA: hypothetical protein VEB88_04910 [Candidatus Acidoferrales bacterium]|nr:hypothetical protein [Candidatus Acidoferrales bacterium]
MDDLDAIDYYEPRQLAVVSYFVRTNITRGRKKAKLEKSLAKTHLIH